MGLLSWLWRHYLRAFDYVCYQVDKLPGGLPGETILVLAIVLFFGVPLMLLMQFAADSLYSDLFADKQSEDMFRLILIIAVGVLVLYVKDRLRRRNKS